VVIAGSLETKLESAPNVAAFVRGPPRRSEIVDGWSRRRQFEVARRGQQRVSEVRRYDFEVEGVPIAGHLHVPAAGEPRAAAVVTGPLTSVKEQSAGVYARALPERGVTTPRSHPQT